MSKDLVERVLGWWLPVALLMTMAMPAASAERLYGTTWRGTLDVFGHYARPGMRHTYQATVRSSRDATGHCRFEWATRDSSDTTWSTEVTLLRGDSVFVQTDGGAWRLLDDRRATQAWLQADAFAGRLSDDRTPNRLTASLHVNADALRKERRITSSWAHPRFGDVDDMAALRFGANTSDPKPMSIEFHLFERDQDWTAQLTPLPIESPALAPAFFAAPDSFALPGPDENRLTGNLTWETIAPGLHLASMDDVESRSLVVEFADSLAVLEASVSSANGERLVNAIHARWPGKPIRWFLFSHHHPHYLGGLRAFVAEGATIAVAPKNRDYVTSIAARRFTREPDRLAIAPQALRITTFNGRFQLADSTNTMIAVNIGTRSQHTDDFLVFWFPRQKVLFETEQGWFARDGATVASRRAAMLLEVIANEGLDVEWIAQSWPYEGTESGMSRDRLAVLVAARGK